MTALGDHPEEFSRGTAVLFVAGVNQLAVHALTATNPLEVGRLEAVMVANDAAERQEIWQAWADVGVHVPLRVIANEHEDWVRSALAYVRSLRPCQEHPVMVVLPELFPRHWYLRLLHNHGGRRLKAGLIDMPWVSVISLPVDLPKRVPRVGRESLGRSGQPVGRPDVSNQNRKKSG